MTTEEQVDLVARYTVYRLLLLLPVIDPYDPSTPRQMRKWREALEETKQELIANGLAIEKV